MTKVDRFVSSRAKIARAEAHRASLVPEVSAFVAGKPFDVRSVHNIAAAKGPIRFVYSITRIDPVPTGWALVAGDAIQNLRAALDHAMWSVVLAKKGRKFAEANAPKIQFPVVELATKFPRKSLIELGVPDKIVDIVEAAQPYSRLANAPRDDLMWCLRTLSNYDKHRLLHVVSMIPEEVVVRPTPDLPGGRIEMLAEGPMRKGQVVRFTAPRPSQPFFVTVNFELKVGVSIEATPETRAIPIEYGIRAMRDRTIEVVDTIESALT